MSDTNDILFSEPQQAQADVVPQQAAAQAAPAVEQAMPLMPPPDAGTGAPVQLQADDAAAQAAAPAAVAAAQQPTIEPSRALPHDDILKVPELTQAQIKDEPDIHAGLKEHIRQLEHPMQRLTAVEPPKETKTEKSFTDSYIKPIGQFMKGIVGGQVDFADQLNALAQAPNKLGAQEGSKPIEDFGQKYERNFGGADVGTDPYKAGQLFGQMGTYAASSGAIAAAAGAAGIPVAGAGALGLMGAGLEGAASGAGQDAREQLRKTGRISDTGGFAGSAALGAGLGVATAGASNAIQGQVTKFGMKRARGLFEKLGDKADALTDDAIEAIKAGKGAADKAAKDIEKLMNDVAAEALAHEIEGVNFVANTFNKLPKAENAFQQAQRAELAKEAQAALPKRVPNGGGSNPNPPNLRQVFKYGTSGRETVVNYPSELESKLVQYISRIKRSETGRNPRPFPEQAQMRDSIASDLGVDGKEVYGIAAKYHAEVKKGAEEASHTTEVFNAPPLAEAPSAAPFRLAKRNKGFANIEHALGLDEIAKHLPADLHAKYSEAVQAMGQAKAVMMHLENEVAATAENAMKHASDKDQLSKIIVQQSTRLRSDAAAEVSQKRAELYLKERMAKISKLDAAAQKVALDHIEDIPMDKYLYGIADKTGSFKVPGKLADSFDAAYKQFAEATDGLKAAERQYKKLAKHFTPIFEEAESAFQDSTGDNISRLFGKVEIANPFNPFLKKAEAPLITNAAKIAEREAFEQRNFPLSNKTFGETGGNFWNPREFTDEQLQQAIDVTNYHRKNKSSKRGDIQKLDALVQEKMRREQRIAQGFAKDWAQPEPSGLQAMTDEELVASMDGATPIFEHEISMELLRRANPGVNPASYTKAATDFAIGLQHKPFTVRMSKAIADEIEALTASLMKQEENVATEITYKLGGIEMLNKQSGKQAMDKLREMGVLHPVAEKLALAAAFGLTALDTPAEAFDGSPKEQKHFFAQLGTVAVATILGAKYGVPAAQRMIRMKGWYYARFLANTRELAGFADSAMGIDAKINPDASLAHNIGALAGKVINAVVQAPDDHIYLLKALHSEVDPKLLSPLGKKLVDEIRDEAKAFQSFVSGYAREWGKVYRGFPDAKKAQLEHIDHAVHFVAENFGKGPRVRNFFDKAMTDLFGRAAQAWFSYNPKIWIGSVADLAITGPLQVGPGAMANAAKMRATNPVVNGLLEQIHLGGVRSQGIQNVAQKSSTLASEAIQNRTMIAASLIHYFETHPRTMKAEGIRSPEEFVRKALTGQLTEDTNADAFVQLASDLAESIGTDPMQLTKGAFGRSMFGKFMQFTSQPERYARLIALRVTTNPKWVAMSLAMMHQIAGQSLLPMSAKIAGLAVAPEATTKLLGFLNMTSAGQHVLGPMSNMLDWDPFLYPAMGVEAPGFSSMLELLGDWPSTSAAMGEVLYQASQGGAGYQRMAGNPTSETNDKAQKALHKLLMQLAIVKPMLGPVPTRIVSSFLYNAPAAVHGVARVNVPAPLHIGDTKPTKPSEVVRFNGATEQSMRAMFGLPDTFKVGAYKTSNAVPKSKGTRLQSNE